jgi:NTE family protein
MGVTQEGTVDVPALAAADIEALRGGSLPAATAAGRAFGWAARDLANLRVGLAFGAGSIKGYAHVGVLQVLERIGLEAECLAGTSVGSAVASTYALGSTSEQVAGYLDDVGGSAFRLTIPTSSLLSNAGLKEGVRRVGRNKRFEDLPRPLAVIAADIATGREVVFRHGLLWPAVLASMSIPGVYPPVRIGRFTLVDGGVVNPVPTNVVSELGADVVIAVKLANRSSLPPVIAEAVEAEGKPPSVIQSITRSIEMMQSKITLEAASAATILLEPGFTDIGGWGLRDFTIGRKYIELGAAAAEDALPRIEATLPWLRP